MKILERIGYVKYLFRKSFWRWLLARVDYALIEQVEPWGKLTFKEKMNIHPTASLREAQNIEIGDHTRIQNFCVLWASPNAKIRIGRYSGLGPGTMLFSSNHQFKPGLPYHKQPWTEADITIGEDVWVGAGSIIVAGVTIGDRCVIGAGSVVTKSIPADSIAAGVPAKVISTRTATVDVAGVTEEQGSRRD